MCPHHSPVSEKPQSFGQGGRVLVVAGSDSSGGAGLQADTKTVTALGGYATTAVTAITAQSTREVFAVHAVPPEIVAAQISAVLEDIGADAVKTGMLCSGETIGMVASALGGKSPRRPLIVDPVMVSTSGTRLLSEEGVNRLREELLPLARLVTPNVPEAEALTGLELRTEDDMRRAADVLLAQGTGAVLLKGGHLAGDEVVDLLVDGEGPPRRFVVPRQRHTPRGTGCTLAAGIATLLSRGQTLDAAVTEAHAYLQRAIGRARAWGAGPLLLDHSVELPGVLDEP